MKKLGALIILVLIASLGFSQSNLGSTNPSDSFYVKVLYQHVIKANQAYIEIKHLRFQKSQLDSAVFEKNMTIYKMGQAQKYTYDLNREYEAQIKSLNKTIADCEKLANKQEKSYKNVKFREGFLRIGTPMVAVVVGAGGFLAGFYISQALKK